ncbi:MAG: hypothetical protein A2Y02_03025 [Omnitrophica bacterium GWA2_52_12]|nr:MAG: hypothetical protein A2Y02_03025 [Omnitrophica bacterium GWA2_52_12]
MCKGIIRFTSALFFLALSMRTTALVAAPADSAKKPDVAALQKQRETKVSQIRDISLVFAEQQMKVAYAKRDKAMFERDRADPNLSKHDQDLLDAKIAEAAQKLRELEDAKSKNREDFTTAAHDYEDFIRANSDVLTTNGDEL